MACSAWLSSSGRGRPDGLAQRRSQRGLGREAAERVSAGCYGGVVAASTLAGSADVPPGRLALLVVAPTWSTSGRTCSRTPSATRTLAQASPPDVGPSRAGGGTDDQCGVYSPRGGPCFGSHRSRLRAGHQHRRRRRRRTVGPRCAPGAYLHGVRGWGLALIAFLVVVMTGVLVTAKVWLTH